jgi:hypothetical protein
VTLIPQSGHSPQREATELTLATISEFVTHILIAHEG